MGDDVFLLAGLHLAGTRVNFGNDAAVGALQDLIQALFQPFLSLSRSRAKAQHLRQKIPHRVGADGILGHGDAAQIRRADGVAHFELDLPCQTHTALGGIGDALIYRLLVYLQHLGQLLGGGADALLLGFRVLGVLTNDVRGGGGDGHGAGRLRQHLAIAVGDLAALGRDGERARPLGERPALQIRAVDDLDVEKSSYHDQKTNNNKTKEPPDAVLCLVGSGNIGHRSAGSFLRTG